MSIFLVQRPRHELVDVFDFGARLLRHVPHDRVHRLGLVVLLFALDDILGRDTSLGQINVPCFLKKERSVNDDRKKEVGGFFSHLSPCRHA